MTERELWVTHQRAHDGSIPTFAGMCLWLIPVGIVAVLVVLGAAIGRLLFG